MTRSQRIPMSNLKALTLYEGRHTTARRSSPVPQLTCRGKACRVYQPDVVQCTAVGEDGAGGLEWSCTADLPKGIRFGSVEVSCEGWDGPDDPYILKGSCGLEYNLVKTSSALEDGSASFRDRFESESPLTSLSNLLFFLASIWAIWRLLKSFFPARRQAFTNFFSGGNNGGGGGGGWGGFGGFGGGPAGGGNNGPPPPYTPKATGTPTDGQSRFGGFWSGALAGAAGASLLNRMQGGGNQTMPRQRAGWGLRDDRYDWDRGVGGSGLRSMGAGSSFSGPSRPSTGFGGTRNR